MPTPKIHLILDAIDKLQFLTSTYDKISAYVDEVKRLKESDQLATTGTRLVPVSRSSYLPMTIMISLSYMLCIGLLRNTTRSRHYKLAVVGDRNVYLHGPLHFKVSVLQSDITELDGTYSDELLAMLLSSKYRRINPLEPYFYATQLR